MRYLTPYHPPMTDQSIDPQYHSTWRRAWNQLVSFADDPADESQDRGAKHVIVGVLWIAIPTALVWAGSVAIEGDMLAALTLLLSTLTIITGLTIAHVRPATFPVVIHALVLSTCLSSFSLTLLYGGLLPSGLNMLWGFVGVLGALIIFGPRIARFWLAGFAGFTVAGGLLSQSLTARYTLSNPEATAVANLTAVAIFVFMALEYFVRQRDRFQRESDDLLRNVLPDDIAERLKHDDSMIAERFDSASVLFADVVDFTPMSASMTPEQLVTLLDQVFSDFDDLTARYGLEKIKTIGDCYMVAAGVPAPRPDHARALAQLALDFRDHVATHRFGGHQLRFRIGIASGPLVAGIIGRKKFVYDLWGDTVNTASRMESNGSSGIIQITRETYDLISDHFTCEPRGLIEIKGKGPLPVWYLHAATDPTPVSATPQESRSS